MFPFIFGQQLKPDSLINNWENGWLLPSVDEESNNKIAVIFWPQYLEYAGFGLLLCFCGSIGIHFIRSKRKTTSHSKDIAV